MKKTKTASTSTTNATPPPAHDWGKGDYHTGFEHTGAEDLGIPFLVVLQKGSPEVDETHPAYETKGIPGAKAGDVVNTIGRRIVHSFRKDPIQFVPATFEKRYVEWAPRESGGGFIRSHTNPAIVEKTTRNEKNQDVLSNGNLLVTTAYFFGHYYDDNDWKQGVIGMSSTQLKKSRQWLNIMMSIKVDTSIGKITPPMFSHIYRLSTVPESNDKGSWMGWKIELDRPNVNTDLIQSSNLIAKQLAEGARLMLAPPSQQQANEESEQGHM